MWVSVWQLGQMKLEMPNEHAIFFHDTPSRHLFANDFRALSHGCVRTERALRDFQRSQGLRADGVAGRGPLDAVQRTRGKSGGEVVPLARLAGLTSAGALLIASGAALLLR